MKIVGRKDQVLDILALLVVLLGIGIAAVIATLLYHQIGNQLHSMPIEITGNDSLIAYDKFEIAWPILDKVLPFITIALTIILLLTSFEIPVANPAYVAVNIIAGPAILMIAGIMSNMWIQVNNQIDMGNITTTYYPITNHIMSWLPFIAAGLILLVSIVTYTKSRSQ